jgi:hypothetical protein
MLTRRKFVHASGAVVGAGGVLALPACTSDSGELAYQQAVQRTWRPFEQADPDRTLLQRELALELVRYATLAASSHNTQCWKFAIADNSIAIHADLSRRLTAVDPDDHHLFVSLGCAAENLIQAALANGWMGVADSSVAAVDGLKINLQPTKVIASPLFEAITTRQCTRAEFDGKPVSNEDLKLLEQAGTGPGIRLMLLTEKSAMEQVLEYVVQGNTAQMNDPAFVSELKTWIRFGDAEAAQSGDGLFTRTSGNPSVPRWLGSPLFSAFFRTANENEKYAKHVRSSAGIAVFVSQANDKAHWMEAGRCYERFALQATALGIRNAFLNQPVEVSALRPQFASFLGIGNLRPDLIVRFGRGPELPRSLRRPVASVMV